MLTTELSLHNIQGTGEADLINVEVAQYSRLPLVVVWYRESASGSTKGARLDIEKRVFLDHFSSETEERRTANAISDLVNDFQGLRGRVQLGLIPPLVSTDELKSKYSAVFSVIDQWGISLSHVFIQDNKLYIAGTAKSEDAKNHVWEQIKQVNPSWQNELICDLTVLEQHSYGRTRTYTVQSGDSLSKIAQQFYGKAGQYNTILEANRDKLSDPKNIQPGQVLKIPYKR